MNEPDANLIRACYWNIILQQIYCESLDSPENKALP